MTITPTADLETRANRRRRIWLVAILLLILFAIAVVWLATSLIRARQQASVANELRNLGALVAYEHHLEEAYEQPRREDLLIPVGRGITGQDFWYDVVSVAFTPVPDNGNPTMLYDPDGYAYLAERQVTDDDLQILASLSALRILSLEGLPITDRAIVHLKKLTSLEELNLKGTHITPEGIHELKRALPSCNIVH